MINISGLIIFVCACMCLSVIIHFKHQQLRVVKHLTFICIYANEACISVRYSKTSNQYGLRTHMIFLFSAYCRYFNDDKKQKGDGMDASLEVSYIHQFKCFKLVMMENNCFNSQSFGRICCDLELTCKHGKGYENPLAFTELEGNLSLTSVGSRLKL